MQFNDINIVCLTKVLDPTKRLGCAETGGFAALKAHPFFKGTDWENLHKTDPPHLLPYLPAKSGDAENLWSQYQVTCPAIHCASFR